MDYDFAKTEKKWAKKWVEDKTFSPDLKRAEKPYYALFMFPYPSAEGLHMGNFYAFTCVDAMAKYKRLRGFDVFEPVGFDAFGIHSENYALKIGETPRKMLDRTEANFRKQLVSAGIGCDWTREVDTTLPQYYRWTQWIFLQLFKRGIAFQKKALLNWCPECKTVLADEQIEEGKCERCGMVSQKKNLKQWFFKITDYAEKLLDGLDEMDWSEITKSAQKNWIGRSDGAEIDFQVNGKKVTVFTTRADTVFGTTYLVLSPEHPIVSEIVSDKHREEVDRYIKSAGAKSDVERIESKEKTGVFTGAYAINPLNNERVPVWVADYVLMNYGTGAIMAVPAHDERDFEFAKNHGLEIKEVIAPYIKKDIKEGKSVEKRDVAVAIVRNPKDNSYLCLEWKTTEWKSFPGGGLDGDDFISAAKKEVVEETGYKNLKFIRQIGNSVFADFYSPHKDSNINAHFKYLLFELENEERQEIDKKEKDQHKVVWIKEEDVELFLNVWSQKIAWSRFKDPNFTYIDDGILIDSGDYSGLLSWDAREKISEWLERERKGRRKVNFRLRDWCISRQRYWGPPIPIIYCEDCGAVPVSENDLPVLLPKIEKGWEPSGDGKGPLAGVEGFVKASCPQCGKEGKRETDVMDNFLDSAWYFFRYLSPEDEKEIFTKELGRKWLPVDIYIGGNEHAVLHLMYTRFITMFFHDLGLIDFGNPFKKFRANGMILKDGKKMSKSKGNVVNPEECGERFGYDALKSYILFLGPLSEDRSYSDRGIVGTARWINKMFRLREKVSEEYNDEEAVAKKMDETIKKLEEDFEDQKYNTAIASIMEMVNVLSSTEKISKELWLKLLPLTAPFTPSLAEELWEDSGFRSSIFEGENWPRFDIEKIKTGKINLIVQVNGKVRDNIEADRGTEEGVAKAIAMESKRVNKHIAEKEIKKVIFVKDKLINIVV